MLLTVYEDGSCRVYIGLEVLRLIWICQYRSKLTDLYTRIEVDGLSTVLDANQTGPSVLPSTLHVSPNIAYRTVSSQGCLGLVFTAGVLRSKLDGHTCSMLIRQLHRGRDLICY